MPHLRNCLAYLILQRGELELGRMEQEEAASRLDNSTLVAVPIPSSSRGSLLDGPSRLLCVVMGRRQFKYTLLTAAGPLRQKLSRSDLEVVEDQQAGACGFPADLGILANLHPIETLAEAASAVLKPDSPSQGQLGFVIRCTCFAGGGQCCSVTSSCLCLALQVPCNRRCTCFALARVAPGCCGNMSMIIQEEDCDVL